MQIQIDSREKPKAIKTIVNYFDENGIGYFRSKLYVGDYMNLDNPRRIVDRKQNLDELCNNISQQHERFTAELARAKQAGIHIVILCEHSDEIKSLEDVKTWNNPRLKTSPKAVSGERLYKVLSTMQGSDKYSVSFEFCNKLDTGRRIVELLNIEH